MAVLSLALKESLRTIFKSLALKVKFLLPSLLKTSSFYSDSFRQYVVVHFLVQRVYLLVIANRCNN